MLSLPVFVSFTLMYYTKYSEYLRGSLDRGVLTFLLRYHDKLIMVFDKSNLLSVGCFIFLGTLLIDENNVCNT